MTRTVLSEPLEEFALWALAGKQDAIVYRNLRRLISLAPTVPLVRAPTCGGRESYQSMTSPSEPVLVYAEARLMGQKSCEVWWEDSGPPCKVRPVHKHAMNHIAFWPEPPRCLWCERPPTAGARLTTRGA
jgi:hypothetical protein